VNSTIRFSLAAAAVAVAALVGFNVLVAPNVGGGSPAQERPPASTAPVPSPTASPAWVTFTSERYAYSIEHPPDWLGSERGGTVRLNGMEIGSPGTDDFRSRESRRRGLDDGVVVVSAHELAPGETLADFTRRVSTSAACRTGGAPIDGRELDGEPAEQRLFVCSSWDWLQVTAIHGDRGYVVWLVATAPPHAHQRPINQQFLETFHFTD
jgi:hypothetical protein